MNPICYDSELLTGEALNVIGGEQTSVMSPADHVHANMNGDPFSPLILIYLLTWVLSNEVPCRRPPGRGRL
jgi:hypothetical protein